MVLSEVASIGRVQADNGTLSIVIRLATRYITVYQEHQVISGAQTLASYVRYFPSKLLVKEVLTFIEYSISAAFQILLLTGLMFLFGQGEFSHSRESLMNRSNLCVHRPLLAIWSDTSYSAEEVNRSELRATWPRRNESVSVFCERIPRHYPPRHWGPTST